MAASPVCHASNGEHLVKAAHDAHSLAELAKVAHDAHDFAEGLRAEGQTREAEQVEQLVLFFVSKAAELKVADSRQTSADDSAVQQAMDQLEVAEGGWQGAATETGYEEPLGDPENEDYTNDYEYDEEQYAEGGAITEYDDSDESRILRAAEEAGVDMNDSAALVAFVVAGERSHLCD